MARETPNQSYVPRARVRLAIRFEEFSRFTSTPKPPKKPPHLRAGKGVDDKANLSVVKDGNAFVLQAPAQGHGGDPQQQTKSTDNRTHVLEGILPLRMTVSRNGVRTADTCTIELAFLDAPFYPPIIRSCAVECFLGTLTDQDYSREIQGRAGPDAAQGGGHPLSAIPDTWTDANGRDRTNLRFAGFVDEWNVDHPKQGLSIVRLECTDNTRLLIDQDAPAKLVVAADQPLDHAVALYLANFPQFRGLRIEYRPAGSDVPKLKTALAKSAFKPKLGPPPGGGPGAGGAQKFSVWDYLTDLAGSLGLLARFENQTVIFQRPRTLYASKFSGRPDDPFTGRILPSGRQILNRLFIQGSNIDGVSYTRKFSRFNSQNVEVRCFVDETIVEARDIERAYRRHYSGMVVRAHAEGSRIFTGTPNHPVLTRRGWVALQDLVEGDDLVCCTLPERGRLADPHVDAAPTEFSKLFDALQDSRRVERRATGNMDFHGDGRDADVDVVDTGLLLKNGGESTRVEHRCKLFLEAPENTTAGLQGSGSPFQGSNDTLAGDRRPAGCAVGGEGKLTPSFGGHSIETVSAGSGEISDRNPALLESPQDQSGADSCFLCEAVNRGTLAITTSKIIKIERDFYDGHVFNLQTAGGWYTASGVVAHNCYDPAKGKTLVARFPTKKDRQALLVPGDAADEKWTVFTIRGVSDEATLRAIAQSIYEQLGRNEFSTKFSTTALASFGGGNLDPDALDVQAGDTVQIEVRREVGTGYSVGEVEDASANRAASFLKGLGYSEALANAYQAAMNQTGFPSTFRVKNVGISWDQEQGVRFDFEGMNYLEVRQSKNLAAGEEIEPSGSRASPVKVTVDDVPPADAPPAAPFI